MIVYFYAISLKIIDLTGINVYFRTCHQGAYITDWSKKLKGANIYGVIGVSFTFETMNFLRMIGSGCSPEFAWWFRRTK